MTARDRIGRMEPDNQPPGRSRRRPPDEPAEQPAAASPPAGSDLTPVGDVSDSASGLYSLLAGSDTHQQQSDAGGGNGRARDAIIDALISPPPPPDPDLKLVTLGVRVPEYVATAIRTMAIVRHRRQQELVREALTQYVPPQLLAECRAAAERARTGAE